MAEVPRRSLLTHAIFHEVVGASLEHDRRVQQKVVGKLDGQVSVFSRTHDFVQLLTGPAAYDVDRQP